jgi:hypothetical protein
MVGPMLLLLMNTNVLQTIRNYEHEEGKEDVNHNDSWSIWLVLILLIVQLLCKCCKGSNLSTSITQCKVTLKGHVVNGFEYLNNLTKFKTYKPPAIETLIGNPSELLITESASEQEVLSNSELPLTTTIAPSEEQDKVVIAKQTIEEKKLTSDVPTKPNDSNDNQSYPNSGFVNPRDICSGRFNPKTNKLLKARKVYSTWPSNINASVGPNITEDVFLSAMNGTWMYRDFDNTHLLNTSTDINLYCETEFIDQSKEEEISLVLFRNEWARRIRSMEHIVNHVCTYVFTTKGELVLWKGQSHDKWKAAGGYTDPMSPAKALNALRLELMDEMGLSPKRLEKRGYKPDTVVWMDAKVLQFTDKPSRSPSDNKILCQGIILPKNFDISHLSSDESSRNGNPATFKSFSIDELNRNKSNRRGKNVIRYADLCTATAYMNFVNRSMSKSTSDTDQNFINVTFDNDVNFMTYTLMQSFNQKLNQWYCTVPLKSQIFFLSTELNNINWQHLLDASNIYHHFEDEGNLAIKSQSDKKLLIKSISGQFTQIGQSVVNVTRFNLNSPVAASLSTNSSNDKAEDKTNQNLGEKQTELTSEIIKMYVNQQQQTTTIDALTDHDKAIRSFISTPVKSGDQMTEQPNSILLNQNHGDSELDKNLISLPIDTTNAGLTASKIDDTQQDDVVSNGQIWTPKSTNNNDIVYSIRSSPTTENDDQACEFMKNYYGKLIPIKPTEFTINEDKITTLTGVDMVPPVWEGTQSVAYSFSSLSKYKQEFETLETRKPDCVFRALRSLGVKSNIAKLYYNCDPHKLFSMLMGLNVNVLIYVNCGRVRGHLIPIINNTADMNKWIGFAISHSGPNNMRGHGHVDLWKKSGSLSKAINHCFIRPNSQSNTSPSVVNPPNLDSTSSTQYFKISDNDIYQHIDYKEWVTGKEQWPKKTDTKFGKGFTRKETLEAIENGKRNKHGTLIDTEFVPYPVKTLNRFEYLTTFERVTGCMFSQTGVTRLASAKQHQNTRHLVTLTMLDPGQTGNASIVLQGHSTSCVVWPLHKSRDGNTNETTIICATVCVIPDTTLLAMTQAESALVPNIGTMSIPSVNKTLCINRETISIIQLQKPATECSVYKSTPSTAKSNQEEKIVLHIGHYDNRAHHKYDQLDLIQNADQLVWITSSRTDDSAKLNKMLATAQHRGVCRPVLQYGELKLCVEFSDIEYSQKVERLTNAGVTNGTNWLIQYAPDDDLIKGKTQIQNMLQRWFTKVPQRENTKSEDGKTELNMEGENNRLTVSRPARVSHGINQDDINEIMAALVELEFEGLEHNKRYSVMPEVEGNPKSLSGVSRLALLANAKNLFQVREQNRDVVLCEMINDTVGIHIQTLTMFSIYETTGGQLGPTKENLSDQMSARATESLYKQAFQNQFDDKEYRVWHDATINAKTPMFHRFLNTAQDEGDVYDRNMYGSTSKIDTIAGFETNEFCENEEYHPRPVEADDLEGWLEGPYNPPDPSGEITHNDQWVSDAHHLTYNYWDNKELGPESLTIRGPTKVKDFSVKVKSRNFQPHVTNKYTMVQYPVCPRDVKTKYPFCTLNSVMDVYGARENVQKNRSPYTMPKPEEAPYKEILLNVSLEVEDFVKTYASPDFGELRNEWKNNLLRPDPDDIIKWLKARPGDRKIWEDLNLMLDEGICSKPLSNINVHPKLESLLKGSLELDPGKTTQVDAENRVRIIAWQDKCVAAIFSPVFINAKKRLKRMLKHKVIYTDGLTVNQLSARARCVAVDDNDIIVEDDLAKQDRQTTDDLLDIEFEIYRLLGVDNWVCNVWRSVHYCWRARAEYFTFTLSEMRLTGQATTALGNAIVNLLVHKELVRKMGQALKLMLVLGDDNLIISQAMIDIHKHRKICKDKYNMMSTTSIKKGVGIFCRLLLHQTNSGTYAIGPDYCRLCDRFQVTNGVSNVNATTLAARRMSYMAMLGDIPQVRNNFDDANKLNLIRYYNQMELVAGLVTYYRSDMTWPLDRLNALINMMKQKHVWHHKFEHWAHKNVRPIKRTNK